MDAVVAVMDQELRTRGTTLAAWAARWGLTPLALGVLVEVSADEPHPVVLDLLGELGISLRAFRRLVREAERCPTASPS